ncbi:NAD(P)H-binding protein [Pontixanthobacter luteolus]|uniref:NAD(P)H-binding protein n=1 Tax=Pontixanthobacter luteolus TaxID=295089 RepID=UPI002303F114|nr:NAD(P)H-binding protein [Pontixanthobacter luteolus]
MSDPVRIALVGATGLIGRTIMEESAHRADLRVLGIARREARMPTHACMEMVVAQPGEWGAVLERVKPDVIISALGTTWKKAGKDEDTFRAVDHDLVLETAQAAQKAGVKHIISISSAGADAASKNFYLRVKGETDRDLLKVGFDRVDIFRPGLLRGKREDDMRVGEKLAMIGSPLIDAMMQGKYRKYRSVPAETVGRAALALSMRKAAGKFVHDTDGIRRAANSLPVLQD